MPRLEDRLRRKSSCYGNMFVRRQYYGSMELLPPSDESAGPLQRKAGRFRVEPSKTQEVIKMTRPPSLAKLENPEFQCRWYFKFLLGVAHKNYAFLDVNKEAHALSVCITDAENHGIPQYRAILWRKQGCCRISFPFDPNQKVTAKHVLRLFGFEKIYRNPREIVSPDVQKEFLVLEEQEGSVYFKFGVIYAKVGQSTDDEMFGNEHGSEEFEDFLHVLGDTIELKGWTGYRGGLDEKDNMTGINSVYTIFEGHEVMFHVSTMLPYSKGVQQVERKRHIGNDIAVIVFVDGEPDEELAFKPSSIRTKFTHVFIVTRYSKITKDYWISVFSEESVPVFGPPLPSPARFKNPQEFRSFLITKLMNGEKAAYASPVFSNKRQRTLESLIEGLQTEKWSKPERFGIRRPIRITMDQGDKKREVGQTLKVNMITLGRAPTSVANVGGLQALKNTPWNSIPVLSTFTQNVICGDSYYNALIVSSDDGIYHVTDTDTKLIYDSSMTAVQLNVLEDIGIFVMRLKKSGCIYVIPLHEIDIKHPFAICRRQCAKYYLKKTKGAHLHDLSHEGTLSVVVRKRLSLYTWSGEKITPGEAEESSPSNRPSGEFKKQEDFSLNGSPKSLTTIQSVKNELYFCLGYRTRFDVINVQTKEVSVLKNFVAYRKSKIVSALDVFDDKNPELLLTYCHTSVFVQLKEGLSEVVSFHWNNAPTNIACAFPFLLGFSENSIEIRLLVNGNLVHTLCVPAVQLITCKNDIFFTSCQSNIPTIDRHNIPLGNHSFSKIRLSDLAGFDLEVEDNEETDLGSLPRNVGVYESVKRRDGHFFKRLDNTVRSYSTAALTSYPGRETSNDVVSADKIKVDSSGQQRSNSCTLKARSSNELNNMDCHSVNKKNRDNSARLSFRSPIDNTGILRSESAHDPSSRPVSYHSSSQTSFFYTTHNVVVHSQQTPKKDRTKDHISPSRGSSSQPDFDDCKRSPATGKTRENFPKMEFYDPKVQYGTSVNKKFSSPTFNVDVLVADPFHKKTTIV